jgi:hypothetical protein
MDFNFKKRQQQPKPKKEDCQIEVETRGDRKRIRFKGNCTKEQIEIARSQIGE